MKDLLHQSFVILEEIKSVTSTTQKAEILKANKDNFILKSILYLTYNPFLIYNLKKVPNPDTKPDAVTYDEDFDEFVTLLTNLNKRIITGNEAINNVSAFLSNCSEEEKIWFTRVIQKDLKVGLADKGINRVFKDLIPVYEILLANKIDAKDLNLDTKKAYDMLPDRIVCQYKIDGYRLNIFVEDSGVVLRTRNGKQIYGYDEIEKEALEKLPKGYVYDGEIVAPELFDWIQNNIESGEFTTANRDLFAEVISHAFSKEDNKQGIFNMFDMVPIKEWTTKKTTETLEVRTNRMNNMISPLELKHIRVVPTYGVYSKDNPKDLKKIVEHFHEFLRIGFEGLMIKNYDSVYEFKRSNNLLKMKLMLSADLEVTDVYEGKQGTKYEGMLGGVYVSYPASDGNNYIVGVGSGWSDEERILYWEHPELIVGKTIEVKYQAETKNQDGGYSVSFPVKKVIREDK